MPKRSKQKRTIDTDLVRPSRDGDQFHYLWAARRCLNLLPPGASLKSVTIEGASPSEQIAKGPSKAGDEVIDVAEYYGDTHFERATLVRYIQLKHSTRTPNKPWPPSGLENTLSGFGKRYKALQAHGLKSGKGPKLEFRFVSNRPISPAFALTVENTANGLPVKEPDRKKLEGFTGLKGASLELFCASLKLEGRHDALWDQRNILFQEVSHYLPDADVDAPAQLKELVTKKAGSDGLSSPSIDRMDVLRALKTGEDRLYPAPCRIEQLANAVPREQESELVAAIVDAGNAPIIIHADGGVGKSIFAGRIGSGLPSGSACILYDCFGNGLYRSATGYRHRHKDALVQIVNELSGKALCHLLIPTKHAEPADYLKVFLFRLEQAVRLIRTENPKALLCIVVDAADNAQMAAEDIGEARSFIRDLLRERIPDGVRLVALCRSHRQEKLDPPPPAIRRELKSFSRSETAAHLRRAFPDASEQDVDEFHRLSSQNPRVQALALAGGGALAEILRRLGPNPTSVERAIGNLLSAAIAKLRDEVGQIEKTQINRICAGLAALRPLIPISVLAAMSDVPASAIKSFAYDLGRPLVVAGETIQFFDEPSETWFREQFKPTAAELAAFISSLKPLSAESAYVAAAIPQLMLEAGHIDELVSLALSSEALPDLNPLDRRDVELQRLQFALKASLRSRRYLDAAKLALKTGGETAGDERQRKLLQGNIDLASALMGTDRIQELVSRRTFGSKWVGSHNAYEAALMSVHPELQGDARSRLRMAAEWLNNWARLSPKQREKEPVGDGDIAEISTAYFNIHGAKACAAELARWTSRMVSFRVGRRLGERFIDHSRYQDIENLAVAAGNNLHLALALVLELREVNRRLPKAVLKNYFDRLVNPRFRFKTEGGWDSKYHALEAVTALVEALVKHSIGTPSTRAWLLARYLPRQPPRGLESRYSTTRTPILRSFALHAALQGKTLTLLDVAHPELRAQLKKDKNYSTSHEAQEFKEAIGALLPWYILWASCLIKPPGKAELAETIGRTLKESGSAASINHGEEWRTADEIAELWQEILILTNGGDPAAWQQLDEWIGNLKRPLFTPTLSRLSRRAARSEGLSSHSLQYANQAFLRTREEREHAESKSNSYIDLVRSVLPVSRQEAEAYFNEAVEVSSRIGDENIDRWAALLDLAEAAADRMQQAPEMAYRLSRCAEVTYDYVARDKHFDWERTVEAIAGLCPTSSFAILSRWRDRNFGWAERVLPIAVNFLVKRKLLDAQKALPLLGFRAHWDLPAVIEAALGACATCDERQALADFSYGLTALTEHSVETWQKLKDVFANHQVMVSDLDARLALQEGKETRERAEEQRSMVRPSKRWKEDSKKDWDAIFDGLDIVLPNGLSLAEQRFRGTEPPFYQEQFFRKAVTRIPAGKEAEFVAAISQAPEFDLYHLRAFLESIPAEWKTRLAVKAALSATLRSFCRRYCMDITRSRHYEILPLKTACELAGVPESDVIDVVLSGIGEVTEIVGVGRLFTLVALLAGKLTRDEALEALGFGLDLLGAVLKETDGDGPWSPSLAPPRELDQAIAGYVFGALASPTATIRWEGAHAVRAICLFARHEILSALVRFVSNGTGGAFADASLYFYQLHARQWLLIALARAVQDRPDVVAVQAPFIMKHAQPSEMHVMMRELAKRIAVRLLAAGSLPPELHDQIIAINVSPFPFVEDSHARSAARATSPRRSEQRIYFGFDFGPYWFSPLGRCFALSEEEISERAATVIATDFNYQGRLHWDEDARTRREILKHDDTHHSHGSYPKADDFRFYLSFHAMMLVAGQLLASMPTFRPPDNSADDFSEWLRSRHDLSRQDGYWLADRRDPIPPDTHFWTSAKPIAEWPVPIRRADFERVLFASDGMMAIWGYWTSASGYHEEVCHVRSALVSPARSSALLRALQSADNHHDYRVPNADDDTQIDFGPYRWKGWVIDRDHDRGIDKKDPWAGNIGYPAPAPSPEIIDLMKLVPDREHRHWRQGEAGPIVAIAETWGRFREKDDDTREQLGQRLRASLSFVLDLLRKLGMDLIVEVEIERGRSYSRYESRSKNDTKPDPRSTQLFLVKREGHIRTI